MPHATHAHTSHIYKSSRSPSACAHGVRDIYGIYVRTNACMHEKPRMRNLICLLIEQTHVTFF